MQKLANTAASGKAAAAERKAEHEDDAKDAALSDEDRKRESEIAEKMRAQATAIVRADAEAADPADSKDDDAAAPAAKAKGGNKKKQKQKKPKARAAAAEAAPDGSVGTETIGTRTVPVFAEISTALSKAKAGDVIFVEPGAYHESRALHFAQSVQLVGRSRASVVITEIGRAHV